LGSRERKVWVLLGSGHGAMAEIAALQAAGRVGEPTRGAIPRIYAGEARSAEFQPLLEVQDIRTVGVTNGADTRYCVSLSDNEFVTKAVFGIGPLQKQFDENRIGLHSLVRLDEWSIMEIARKSGGRDQQVLTIGRAEAVGTVHESRRVNLASLRKYPESGRGGGAMSQVTQHQPYQMDYTTPEKRMGRGSAAEAAEQTPPPLAPAVAAATSAHDGGARCFDGGYEKVPSDSLAEVPTQGAARVGDSLPPLPPHAQTPAMNPYSVGAAGQGNMQSGMPVTGSHALPHTSSYGGSAIPASNPYSVRAAASEVGRGHAGGAPVSAMTPSGGFGGAATANGGDLFSAPLPMPQAAPVGHTPGAMPAGGRSTLTDYFGGGRLGGSTGGAGGQGGAGGGPLASPAGGGVAMSQREKNSNCMPITELSPYGARGWRIKARVLTKSDIRRFTNNRGEGQLFKVDLVDKFGGEVSATFFDRAVDRFFEMLRPQQVYYFSKGTVKMANRRFDRGNHVLTFEEGSIIDLAEEDGEIPGVNYVFQPLAGLQELEATTAVDVRGVIAEVREISTIVVKRTNEERPKRDLVLWDDSGSEGSSFVEMTMWGEQALGEFEVGVVLCAKAARVSVWNDVKTLNNGGHYELNPDNEGAFSLTRKFNEKKPVSNLSAGGRGSGAVGPTGGRETIEEVKAADTHLVDPPAPGQPFVPNGPRSVNRHVVNGTVTVVPVDRPPFYYACPQLVEREQRGATQQMIAPEKRPCHKKLTQAEGSADGMPGTWSCQLGHACTQPVARYLCNRVQVCDHTGSFDISFFDEVGRQIFECEADEIARLWDDPSRDMELQQRLKRAQWKRVALRISSKREVWQDERRIRVNAEDAAKLNFVREGQRMLTEVMTALSV